MNKTTLGFIGLGSMGAPLAGRFADAGHHITVYDMNPAAVEAALRRGAHAGQSAREVGDRAEIVFCCLPAPHVSESAAGELRASSSCRVLVEMSTVGRASMQRIIDAAGTGIEVVDSPISGGPKRVIDGTLTAIAAAPPALMERVRPLLELVASKIFVVGTQAGQAQICKIANNAISATGLAVACEAVVMGVKAGLDPVVMIDAINACTGRNTATTDKFPKAILPRTFDFGGPISTPAKDLNLFLEEARAQHVSALTVGVSAQLWSMAADRFGASADFTVFIRMLEEWAGLGADGRPRQ